MPNISSTSYVWWTPIFQYSSNNIMKMVNCGFLSKSLSHKCPKQHFAQQGEKYPGCLKGRGRVVSSNIDRVGKSYTALQFSGDILYYRRKKKGRRQVETGIQDATLMSNNQILVFYVSHLCQQWISKAKIDCPTQKTFIPPFKKQILNHKPKNQ